MRLRPEFSIRFCARLLGGIAGCVLVAGCSGGRTDFSEFDATASQADTIGASASDKSADYPVILGAPFLVDGTFFTPRDMLNYDEIGYATRDLSGDGDISIAHRTLPIPSYVELTALDSGRTIVARVERRGPMQGPFIVGLSSGAASQLGANTDTPIRARRVLPPESERALLRQGSPASARADMPLSLVNVLRRKLPVSGSVDIAMPITAAQQPTADTGRRRAQAEQTAGALSTLESFDAAFRGTRQATAEYPLKPLAGVAPRAVAPARAVTVARTPAATGAYIVQAAAFSERSNATRAAKAVGGFVEPSGRFYRVRIGPFAERGQAEAALAKARDAGYGSARVFTTG